jgi:amino acid adenylation domain-containing protein
LTPVPPGSVVQAFTRVVAAHPDRTAVIAEDGELTYAELDARSARLAEVLREQGCGRGHRVGVLLPRTTGLAVAILGILRAGAVLVPFDPEQSAPRLRRMVRAAELSAAVTADAAAAAAVPHPGAVPTVRLDAVDWKGSAPREVTPVPDDAPLYIVFTSGSTGQPKGVEVPHRALVAFLHGMESAGFFRPAGMRVAWNSSMAFDASVQQWVRFLRGDVVAILSDDMRRDPAEFADFVRDHRLTEIDMTPSHAVMLIDELEEVAREGLGLRLLLAGEAVPDGLWARLARLVDEGVLEASNCYGPTETTVNVHGTMIVPGEQPTIGRPLLGVQTRIVDERLRPVADGRIGELCIAGPYLARQYVGQPGLTAAAFVPDPLAVDGERMYRTGDRVRRLPDGRTVYHGRTDHQVKIRGHRVELGEIESVLADHEGVTSAVVLHIPERGGDALVAVVRIGPGTSLGDVRRHAERALPAWLRPTRYQVVEVIPLTTGGKADRRRLMADLAPEAPETD